MGSYDAGSNCPISGEPTQGRFKWDVRICFSIVWYENEEDAERAGIATVEQGNTYNGGFYHGMPCKRDPSWDHTDDDGIKWMAVTH